jgi:hypothetical protein
MMWQGINDCKGRVCVVCGKNMGFIDRADVVPRRADSAIGLNFSY